MMGNPEEREGGYIKLHRKWESSPTVAALTPLGEVVWQRLLLAANWKDTTVALADGPRVIQRGQALISEEKLAARARVTRKVVRVALRTLSRFGAIQICDVGTVRGPKTHLITVLNYEALQGDDESTGPEQGPEQGQSGARAGPDQKKGKKGKKEKKKEADHGGVGEKPLIAVAPTLPPDAPPLARWAVDHYPDITNPIEFAATQQRAHPSLDLVAEARKAFGWESTGTPKRDHARFLANWFNNAEGRRDSARLVPARSPVVADETFASP